MNRKKTDELILGITFHSNLIEDVVDELEEVLNVEPDSGAFSHFFNCGTYGYIVTSEVQKLAILELGLFGYEFVCKIDDIMIICCPTFDCAGSVAYTRTQVGALSNTNKHFVKLSDVIEAISCIVPPAYFEYYIETALLIAEKLAELGVEYVRIDSHSGNVRVDNYGRTIPYDIFVTTASFFCHECNEYCTIEQDGYNFADEKEFCDHCFFEKYGTCTTCNKPHEFEDGFFIYNDFYCYDCFSVKYGVCSVCDEAFELEELSKTEDNELVCCDCLADIAT